jgi:hypothetical protein
MINAEKYKDKILTIAEDGYIFAINKNDKNNVIRCCSDMKCQDCMFDDEESEECGYNLPRLKWLFAEYKRPIKLSRLEYEVLKHVQKEDFNFIIRNNYGDLFIHENKPIKPDSSIDWCTTGKSYILCAFNDLFQFVKFEDEEPRSIKEILKNCAVENIKEEQ